MQQRGSYHVKNFKLGAMAFSAEPLILLVGTKTPLRVATLSSLYSQKSISAVPWNENNYYQDASACAGCHSKKWSFVRAGADTHTVYECSYKSSSKCYIPSYFEGRPVIMFDVGARSSFTRQAYLPLFHAEQASECLGQGGTDIKRKIEFECAASQSQKVFLNWG